jgi:hypothetical protein
MGTVPRQESVSNISMHHRELINGIVSLPQIARRRPRPRDARAARGKIKIMIRGLARN